MVGPPPSRRVSRQRSTNHTAGCILKQRTVLNAANSYTVQLLNIKMCIDLEYLQIFIKRKYTSMNQITFCSCTLASVHVHSSTSQDLHLRFVRVPPTCSEQHLGGDVVGRAHQRVGQAALVLPGLPALQGLEAVPAATVGRVLPVLAEVHAVLPYVVPWEHAGGKM